GGLEYLGPDLVDLPALAEPLERVLGHLEQVAAAGDQFDEALDPLGHDRLGDALEQDDHRVGLPAGCGPRVIGVIRNGPAGILKRNRGCGKQRVGRRWGELCSNAGPSLAEPRRPPVNAHRNQAVTVLAALLAVIAGLFAATSGEMGRSAAMS